MKGLFYWINNLNNKFWLKVSKSTKQDVRSLCVYRIIVGLFLLTFSYSNISWVGNIPQAFFSPPVLSIAGLTNGFPSPVFFTAMQLLLILLAGFITVGIKARISTFIYIIISILTLNFQYSLGKIDHSIMTYALLFCMSFSGWGRELALVPDKIRKTDSPEKSLSLVAVAICFAFFSAGFEKALNWINFDLNKNGSGNWFYVGYYILERQYLLAPFFVHLPFWGFKIMDFTAVTFELSPLFFLLHSRKAWRLWLIVACFFHMVNTLVLNINFLGLSIIYLSFINYSFLFDKIKDWISRPLVKITAFCVLFFLIIFRVIGSLTPRPIRSLDDENLYGGYLYYCILFWIILISLIYRDAFKKPCQAYKKQKQKHDPL